MQALPTRNPAKSQAANRAERRRQDAEWLDGMEQFHRTIAGTMASLALVHIGDPEVPQNIRLAILAWAVMAFNARGDARPSCMCCDTRFGPPNAAPSAFTAFFSADLEAILITGVCGPCQARGTDAVLETATEMLGKVFPINRVIRASEIHTGGRA